MKPCNKCGQLKPISDFSLNRGTKDGHRNTCKICARSWYKDYRLRNREKILKDHAAHYQTTGWRLNIKRQYGITAGEYQEYFSKQNGKCAICKSESKRRLNVDHCHVTGKVRGLLCGPCNTLLGMAKDSTDRLAKAIEYLTNSRSETTVE